MSRWAAMKSRRHPRLCGSCMAFLRAKSQPKKILCNQRCSQKTRWHERQGHQAPGQSTGPPRGQSHGTTPPRPPSHARQANPRGGMGEAQNKAALSTKNKSTLTQRAAPQEANSRAELKPTNKEGPCSQNPGGKQTAKLSSSQPTRKAPTKLHTSNIFFKKTASVQQPTVPQATGPRATKRQGTQAPEAPTERANKNITLRPPSAQVTSRRESRAGCIKTST